MYQPTLDSIGSPHLYDLPKFLFVMEIGDCIIKNNIPRMGHIINNETEL